MKRLKQPMRILITGAKGRLGGEISQLYGKLGHNVTGTDLDTLDITNWAQVQTTFDEIQPDLVIHCAALTAVDFCAEHPDEALRVNAFGTHNIATCAQEHGAGLVYISTNEVFPGIEWREYAEYDQPAPVNPYGQSKWAGEQTVRDLTTRHYIVRTSWLFAHGGNNFVQAILHRAREGKPLRVVTNEVSTPTYNSDLANAIVALTNTKRYGIYHLVNSGHVSRYGFARELLNQAGMSDIAIEPIALAEWPRPSRPPEYAILRNFEAAELGIVLRPWQDAIAAFLHAEAAAVS